MILRAVHKSVVLHSDENDAKQEKRFYPLTHLEDKFMKTINAMSSDWSTSFEFSISLDVSFSFPSLRFDLSEPVERTLSNVFLNDEGAISRTVVDTLRFDRCPKFGYDINNKEINEFLFYITAFVFIAQFAI
jgi:hypothetical protein